MSEFCINLDDVKQAKETIRDHARVTPLENANNLGSLCGCDLYLKLETMQRCKAFKFRGALNKMRTLKPGTTVCAVSAGNHSQGVALAASLCGCNSIIFMPENAAIAKVQATKHYGGNVIQKGASFDLAKAAMEDALKKNPEWVFVPPYNDKYIIAGTGTIALEILDDLPNVTCVVVPIGGGGLISGVAYTLKQLNPKIRVIGVQMASCPVTYTKFNELKGREIGKLEKEALTPLADGIAVKSPGNLNLQIIEKCVDEVVVVNEDEVAEAVALLAERSKVIAEGAGATAFAAVYRHKFEFTKDDKIVSIISGGNIQLQMLARCIERALFLRQTRVCFTVLLPYGTKYLLKLMNILTDHQAEVISCSSQPHVDTFANKDRYELIIDLPAPDCLDAIKKLFESKGWDYHIDTTSAVEDDD